MALGLVGMIRSKCLGLGSSAPHETRRSSVMLRKQLLHRGIFMKAIWNGQVIAESENTVVVENNHYFPADSIRREFFSPNDQKTFCPWKGEASYYDLIVGEEKNKGAAWHYPAPKSAAAEIKDRVAFWRGVKVVD